MDQPLSGATGIPLTDEGPVLGAGWLQGLAFLLLISGIVMAVVLWRGPDRRVGIILLVVLAIPFMLTILQVLRLRKIIGTAQLFLKHDTLPLGFPVTATYVRPLRGGATVRSIEVRLQCQEELTKGSGKSKKTYTQVVFDQPITPVNTPMSTQMLVQIPIRIPEQGPPSLFRGRAEIQWWVRIRLVMDGCPNTRSSFQLNVLPVVVRL